MLTREESLPLRRIIMPPYNETASSEHRKRKLVTCMITSTHEQMDEPQYHSKETAEGGISNATMDQEAQSACDDKEKYKCSICCRGFSKKSNMERHMRKHTGERPFGCHVCEARFSYKSTLLNHLRLHTGEKPYTCEFCQKVFRQRSNYTIHRKLHTQESYHVCDECGKQFVQKNNLKIHLLGHSGEKPFACKHCDKRFAQSSLLKQHSQVHIEDEERKIHVCDICSKRFCSNRSLELHVKAHAGIKAFKCLQCGMEFQQRSGLNRHMRRSEYSDMSKCENRKCFRERGYECNFCLKTFKKKPMLRAHMYSHTGEKPYECNQCKAKFSLKSTLKTHVELYCKGSASSLDDADRKNFHGSSISTLIGPEDPFDQLCSASSSSSAFRGNELDMKSFKAPESRSRPSQENQLNTSIPSKSFVSLSRPLSARIPSSPDKSVPIEGIAKMTKKLTLGHKSSRTSPYLPENPSEIVLPGRINRGITQEMVGKSESDFLIVGAADVSENVECDSQLKGDSSIADLSVKEEIDIKYEEIDEEY